MKIVALSISWVMDKSLDWPADHGKPKKSIMSFNKIRYGFIKSAVTDLLDELGTIDILLLPMQTMIRAFDDDRPADELAKRLDKLFDGKRIKKVVYEVCKFRSSRDKLPPDEGLRHLLDSDSELYINSPHKLKRRSIKPAQFLIDSKQAECSSGKFAVQRVAKVLQEGSERTFVSKGRKVVVLNCGETSIFRNEQTNGNVAVPRYGLEETRPWENHDIILNPFHLNMGNMAKHRKRWEKLSENGRHLFAVGNNNSASWLSSLYHFHDGEEIGNGESGDLMVADDDNWRALICEL